MTQILYEHVPILESGELLVDASTYPFVVDAEYFKQNISPDPVVRLRKGVLDRILKAQESFGGKYRFKLWDGYRPRSVQAALYDAFYAELTRKHPEMTADELTHETQRYVTKASDSNRIPPHATGGAIDLTLVDANGNELDMGTVFDHFGPEAKTSYYDDVSGYEQVRSNRQLLYDALIAQGFTNDSEEWWHYDYGSQVWAYHTGSEVAKYGEAALES